jgi:hypothetical protein
MNFISAGGRAINLSQVRSLNHYRSYIRKKKYVSIEWCNSVTSGSFIIHSSEIDRTCVWEEEEKELYDKLIKFIYEK